MTLGPVGMVVHPATLSSTPRGETRNNLDMIVSSGRLARGRLRRHALPPRGTFIYVGVIALGRRAVVPVPLGLRRRGRRPGYALLDIDRWRGRSYHCPRIAISGRRVSIDGRRVGIDPRRISVMRRRVIGRPVNRKAQ